MDQTQLQQKIAQYYQKLPSGAQQVFSSMTWMETLKNISVKYGLKENQIETLATETTLILLGIIGLDEYEENISKDLILPKETLDKIISEINTSILEKIKPELEYTFSKNVESLVEEKYGSSSSILDERFAKLPKEVRDAISKSDYQSKLYEIATEKKLSVEQMGDLEEVTNKILLGIIHPDKYKDELESKLELPADKINEIVESVNEGILKNIREILKNNFNEVKNIDDEVPLPPYASTEQIDEKAGIEILPTENTDTQVQNKKEPVENTNTIPKIESKIYQRAGIDMLSKTMNLDELNLDNNIIAEKLSKPTISKPILSDHSLPKVTRVMNTENETNNKEKPISSDPYREVVN